ncbi:MAG TPA: malto-oligosyltrehalose synthase, partial [Thermoanaerobaculia bacterium]|nr:malto-oligosyltrehalose synthase [Thermoanaerobaculia bacterium]
AGEGARRSNVQRTRSAALPLHTKRSMYRVPIATYRLQFNAGFTFKDARAIAAYLAQLGITDIYSSPIFRARKGSTHGYDIVDASMLNPELGSDDDFQSLHDELTKRKLGYLLDIVPNHMAASHENAWWMSVLENGPQSRFLHYFDIDWRDDKVLLPILGRPYGEALEEKELQLGFDAEGFFIGYFDKRLPVAPHSYVIVLRRCADALPAEGVAVEVRDLVANDAVISNSRFLKDTLTRLSAESSEFQKALDGTLAQFNNDPNALDELLAAQWYRLAYWRIASETINYRRFFDVTDLVGLKMENPEVFEIRNRSVIDWVAEGKITGLRVDHIDGLLDPLAYLNKLQARLDEHYVVVEKILAHDEVLPPSFHCAGTTGYDFLDTANAAFIDPAGLASLTDFYRSFTGITQSFEDLCYERKKQVINDLFFGEMRALGSHVAALAVADRNARDFAPSELIAALIEITACMHVYRSYVREVPIAGGDREWITRAITEARHRAAHLDKRLFHFLEMVLLLEPPDYIAQERERWLEFVMRWQQFTGRVMAKGVEDTSFYNYNRLISLNEVGGEPGRSPEFDPVAELHARNERIARDWPHTMNATSTHDTKRSEDVRARIHVLSEIAGDWTRHVKRWSKLNKHDGAPDANEELLIYQTLAGMWPLDDAELASVPDRLRAYLEKAAREAKTHSSWLIPNVEHEKALQDFATGILEKDAFRASFTRFQKRVAFHGFLNALSQVVLKATSPGLPDFYQGTELWDFSLVDPDNRRPVDYDKRAALLRDVQTATPSVLLRNWSDGRVKLYVTHRTLLTRAAHADTFRDGAYRAVTSESPNVIAYTRGDDILVAVPRLTTQLVKPPQLPLAEVWRDHALDIGGAWKNIYTGETVDGDRLALSDVFASFPVAVFERA